jgi:hypothetical protein
MEPMECKRVPKLPEGDAWLYEIKQDGYRVIAVVDGSATLLYSMSGLDYTSQFPNVSFALKMLKETSVVFDGEIVALDRQGRASNPQAAPFSTPCSTFSKQAPLHPEKFKPRRPGLLPPKRRSKCAFRNCRTAKAANSRSFITFLTFFITTAKTSLICRSQIDGKPSKESQGISPTHFVSIRPLEQN